MKTSAAGVVWADICDAPARPSAPLKKSRRSILICSGGARKNFAQAAAHDHLLARLQHPYSDDDGVGVGMQAGAAFRAAGRRIQLDAGGAAPQLLLNFRG